MACQSQVLIRSTSTNHTSKPNHNKVNINQSHLKAKS